MPKLIHFLKGVLLPFFQKRKEAVAAVHRIAGFQILQRQGIDVAVLTKTWLKQKSVSPQGQERFTVLINQIQKMLFPMLHRINEN